MNICNPRIGVSYVGYIDIFIGQLKGRSSQDQEGSHRGHRGMHDWTKTIDTKV